MLLSAASWRRFLVPTGSIAVIKSRAFFAHCPGVCVRANGTTTARTSAQSFA